MWKYIKNYQSEEKNQHSPIKNEKYVTQQFTEKERQMSNKPVTVLNLNTGKMKIKAVKYWS